MHYRIEHGVYCLRSRDLLVSNANRICQCVAPKKNKSYIVNMLYKVPFEYIQNEETFVSNDASSKQAEATPAPVGGFGLAIGVIIIALLWVILGIGAFVMSLVCFGRSGSLGLHIVGLLLAIFFGPFYWIYFLVVKSYCGKGPSQRGGGSSRVRKL